MPPKALVLKAEFSVQLGSEQGLWDSDGFMEVLTFMIGQSKDAFITECCS